MKIWNRPRGTGKTTRMLYASEYTGKNILVPNNERKHLLQMTAKQLHLDIPEIYTVNDFFSRVCYCSKEIIIDEAFDVLEAFVVGVRSGTKISDITICSPMKDEEGVLYD